MKVERTDTRVSVRKDRRVPFLLVSALFAAAALGLWSAGAPAAVIVVLFALLAGILSLVPYYYRVEADKGSGRLLCVRKSLYGRKRTEVDLCGLNWLRTDEGAEMLSVMAETGEGAVKLITLPDDEADEVVGHVNRFLKGAGGTGVAAAPIEGTRHIALRCMPLAAFVVFSAVAIVLSFFEEVLWNIREMRALEAAGVALFFAGALYLLVSLVWHFMSGTSNRLQLRLNDSATNVALSLAIVIFSTLLIAAALF
ncbi:MAG: hypothetical protein Kow0025_16120 [Thermodesulfovibrionales bacterium]